jgi:adenylyl-sulfate kinase
MPLLAPGLTVPETSMTIGFVRVHAATRVTGQNMRGVTIWLTGLPGSGKTTIAVALRGLLRSRGYIVELFDGDELRSTVSRDLGFDKADRIEHVSRVAGLAETATNEGKVALVALIAPYRETRERVRSRIARFMEIYVHCPQEELIRRDPKGLYKKALRGEVQNFTGISDPYEPPLSPEVSIDTTQVHVDEAVAQIVKAASHLGYLDAATNR